MANPRTLIPAVLLLPLLLLGGCSDDHTGSGNGADDSSDPNDTSNTDPNDTSGNTTGNTTGVCQTSAADADLEPVYLVFAFDVSGSMGQMDKLWHDPTLKWDPVVEATTAFLEDDAADEFFAAMTFFPATSDKCDGASYTTPDVPMTALPSTDFAATMAPIRENDSWRGGTPTLAVLDGVHTYINAQKETTPGNYAIVLVTDGYPEGCGSDDNDITAVANVAKTAADDGINTYVIGVNNPPIDGAPDTLDNLNQVAQAGGSGSAFLIDTGDPARTAADVKTAIDQIRGAAFSCSLKIPAPPAGETFDKEKVLVTATADGTDVTLNYDASCALENAWHYDDPADPTRLLLCESTCDQLSAAKAPAIEVAFTCEQTITLLI